MIFRLTTLFRKKEILMETSIVIAVPTIFGVNVKVYVPSLLSVTALKFPELVPLAMAGATGSPPIVCGVPLAL
ncbi:hypothetical protein D3C87_1182690 [compost metagenome]